MSAPPVEAVMEPVEGEVKRGEEGTPAAVDGAAVEVKLVAAEGEDAANQANGNGHEQASSTSNGSGAPSEQANSSDVSVNGASTKETEEKPASSGDTAMQDVAPAASSGANTVDGSPREGTPALSEAASETASVATSAAPAAAGTASASVEPNGTSELAFPLSAYTFSNTTLVPLASTSTTPFFFQTFPPQELEECWTRSKRSDDPEAYEPPDRDPGYFASPEELEASKIREAARQKRIQARLTRLNMWKGKGKEESPMAPTPPPEAAPPPEKRLTGRAAMKAKAAERAAAAANGTLDPNAPLAPRRGRPPKAAYGGKGKKETAAKATKEAAASKQAREPSPAPEPEKPFTTRYNRKMVNGLFPDDSQTATPIYLEPHPAFVDLFDLPPHYMPDGPILPAPAPTPAAAPAPEPAPESAAEPAPAPAPPPAPPADPSPAAATAPDAAIKAPSPAAPPPAPAAPVAPTTPAAPAEAIATSSSGRPVRTARTARTAALVAASAAEASPAATPEQTLVVEDEPMPAATSSSKRARPAEDDGKKVGRKKARESSSTSATPAPADGEAVGPPVNWVVQSTSCLSKKVDGQIRCFQCISRSIGHKCSFEGIRSFGVDAQGRIVTAPVFQNNPAVDEAPKFDREITRPYNSHDTELLKTWLAPDLSRILKRENQFAAKPDAIKIRRDLTKDTVCDTCNTAQAGSHFMCTNCGRVACRICHEQLKTLEGLEAKAKPFPSPADAQRRRKCVAKKRGKAATDAEVHKSEHFISLTPFAKDEIAALHKEVAEWHANRMLAKTDPKTVTYLRRKFNIASPLPQYDVNAHKINSVQHSQLSEPIFFELWRMGEPVIVKKVPLGGMSKFTPMWFGKKCENWVVDLLNNYGTETLPSNGNAFFKNFNEDGFRREDDGKSSFRAKDFPSPKTFAHDLLEVQEEFYKTLPLPNIFLPNGIYNMLAHAPSNAYQPHLGPRLTASWETNAKWGTTQLQTHCTDTAALMFWGGKDPNSGKPLRVRWDVFRTEDIDKLREYCWDLLTRKLPKNISATKYRETHDDPVLSPSLYLTKSQRLELFNRYGVKPFPLYQFEGDLVLIPAGCPFQVSSWVDHLTMNLSFLGGARTNAAVGVNKGMQYATRDRQLWRQDNVHLESQLIWTWQAAETFEKAEKERLAKEAAEAAKKPKPLPSVLEPVPAGADTGAAAAASAAAASVPPAVPATTAPLPPLPPVDDVALGPAIPRISLADPLPAEAPVPATPVPATPVPAQAPPPPTVPAPAQDAHPTA
ncbi:hypothetical protein JCM6882_005640 [Rhodosporidiobolus microsporus]